jgi:ribonuclease HII
VSSISLYTVHMQRKKWILGVDEVGRGPLAGPVSVGVFVAETNADLLCIQDIKDSKITPEKKREQWFGILKNLPQSKFCVASESAQYIDTYGIVPAISSAMKKALTELALNPEDCEVLLDGGLYAPEEYKNQKTIIKGDATILHISAAAMVAKVKRDAEMKVFDREYPQYFFQKNKGYGTKDHIHAIQEHGVCPIHRVSFCKKIV